MGFQINMVSIFCFYWHRPTTMLYISKQYYSMKVLFWMGSAGQTNKEARVKTSYSPTGAWIEVDLDNIMFLRLKFRRSEGNFCLLCHISYLVTCQTSIPDIHAKSCSPKYYWVIQIWAIFQSAITVKSKYRGIVSWIAKQIPLTNSGHIKTRWQFMQMQMAVYALINYKYRQANISLTPTIH